MPIFRRKWVPKFTETAFIVYNKYQQPNTTLFSEANGRLSSYHIPPTNLQHNQLNF